MTSDERRVGENPRASRTRRTPYSVSHKFKSEKTYRMLQVFPDPIPDRPTPEIPGSSPRMTSEEYVGWVKTHA